MTESAAPARRAAEEEPIRAGRRVAVLDYEPEQDPYYYDDGPAASDPEREWDQPTAVHSHFDEMMEEWNTNYGVGASRDFDVSSERAFDLADPGAIPAQGARRTVVITGHGDERYLPAPRQRRSSELRFHERSSFSPDRLALWAVLLALALAVGSIAH